jgi:hypothetical protein
MDQLNEIEKAFAVFRDRLFEDRIAAIDAEIGSLKDGTHAEYLAMEDAIDARRDDKVEREDKLREYSEQAIMTRSRAERAQLHSQFAQTVRKLREDMLGSLFDQNTLLRRGWEGAMPDTYNTFPAKREQQLLHQAAYNKEVSILAGVAKYRGFPAAPTLWTMKREEVTNDLKAMGLV